MAKSSSKTNITQIHEGINPRNKDTNKSISIVTQKQFKPAPSIDSNQRTKSRYDLNKIQMIFINLYKKSSLLNN
jgi:hypothetical protein